ncbi:MAG: malto-oligosyltrehalose trehalohydrolase, partial [Opitutaceae bacterium]
MERRLPVGAEVQPEGGVHFRVWAPASRTAGAEFFSPDGKIAHTIPLTTEVLGYFSGFAADAKAGDRYKIKLDHGSFPDPVSRFQPDGVHGPSQIVDPAFRWTDADWRGKDMRELVIYELHVGTFTPEGTWRSAIEQLPELARFGITMIEIMPIAEFP